MGSSSKPKSSKKKSSKIHSQPRKMKKVKKSRRSKSKKVTRRHDTSSDDSQSIAPASNDSHYLYSDSDSMNSVSFSSSSSEGTYRARKKVSRVRSKLKSKRKRVRRRSSSCDSSEDFSSKKKRKRSKKNVDSKSRKKSRKYKPRRDVKSSSATSDSHGSSPCKEESSSFSEESADKKLRMKSKKSKTHKRESQEERVEAKKRTRRSPSCSSYSRSWDQSYSVGQGEENFRGECQSRRLRSVITFVEQAQSEGSKSEKDSLKEEIVYEHDDYPSPRSNDSSHGGSKKDVSSHSPVTSGSKRQKERVDGEETYVCNDRATEANASTKIADDRNGHQPFLNECQADKYEKESRTHGSLPDANSGADDLEAILRQKALENLKKFRGVVKNGKSTTNEKNKDAGDADQSFSSKTEIVHRVLPKQYNTNVIDRVQLLDRRTGTTSVRIADGRNSGMGSGNSKEKTIHPPDVLSHSGKPLKEDYTTKLAIPESESRNSSSGKKAPGMASSLNQAMVLQTSSKNKLTENIANEKKIPARTSDSIKPSIINHSEKDSLASGVNNASSCATVELVPNGQSTSQGQGSNKQETEAKDGSQYEEKTMTVMRGGELVQVSYKVYIPKRAPGLARRQLRR